MIESKRRIFRTGGREGKSSLAVSLPKNWCDFYAIKPGAEVTLVGDGILILVTDASKVDKIKKALTEGVI